MKILMVKNVQGIGNVGDIKEVSEGYARNFLFPKKLALLANEAGKKQYEQQTLKQRKLAEKALKEAKEHAEKIEKISCTISTKVGEDEKMYGSVTTGDIAENLTKQGINIDKKIILLENPIKELGVYTVDIKLHHDITAKLKVWVVEEK